MINFKGRLFAGRLFVGRLLQGITEAAGENASVYPIGVYSAGRTNAATPTGNAAGFIAGVAGYGVVGGVNVWRNVINTQNPNWTFITDTQTSSWATIDTAQTPDWELVLV